MDSQARLLWAFFRRSLGLKRRELLTPKPADAQRPRDNADGRGETTRRRPTVEPKIAIGTNPIDATQVFASM